MLGVHRPLEETLVQQWTEVYNGGLQKEVRGRGDMRIISLSLTLLCDGGPET